MEKSMQLKTKASVGGHDNDSSVGDRSDSGSDGDHLDDLGQVFNSTPSASSSAQPDGCFEKAIEDLSNLFNVCDETGPAINAAYANILNGTLRRKPSDEQVAILTAKYKRPQNLQHLSVPRMNVEVWDILHKGPKMTDLVLQKALLALSKGLVPIIQLINEIGNGEKAKRPMVEAMDSLNDAKRLIIASFNYINQGRKEVVRNDVRDPRFSRLCSWDTTVGDDLLFGDLSKRLADLDMSGKLSGGIRSRQSKICNTATRQGAYKSRQKSYKESRATPYKRVDTAFLGRGKRRYKKTE
jgi:hypothetical protein